MASLPSLWPQSDPPKPQKLLFVRISKSVDEVFGLLWLSSNVSVALHTKRNDSNFLESSWFSSKQDLPEPAYAWETGPADAQQKLASSALRFRRARFESAPSALASKPFQNDETQQLTTFVPGKRYVIEAYNTTTAPYGDKFKVWLRHIIVPSGPNSTLMLIEFGAEFFPSMNRLMKPVIGKAIEGGVRGTFKIFRQCLADVAEIEDVKDEDASVEASLRSDVLPTDAQVAAQVVPKASVPAPVVPPPVQATFAPQPTPARTPTQGGAVNGVLSFVSDQLISHDQVAQLSELIGTSIRSMHQINVIARIAALLLTLSLLHLTVGVMRSLRSACSGGSRFLALLCWPLYLIDLPDNTTEVLSSLALVGAINLLVIRATKAAMAYMMYYTQRVSAGSFGSAYQAAAGSFGGMQHSESQVATADLVAARGSAGLAAVSPKKGSSGGAERESAENGAVAEVKGSSGMQGGSFPKARRSAPPARPHAFPPPPPLVRPPVSPITVEMANIASRRKPVAPVAALAPSSGSATALSPAGSPVPAVCTSPLAGGAVSPAVPVKLASAKPQSPPASVPGTTATVAATAPTPSGASHTAIPAPASPAALKTTISAAAAPKATATATAAAAASPHVGAAAAGVGGGPAIAHASPATGAAAAAPVAAGVPGGLARVKLPGSASSINLGSLAQASSLDGAGSSEGGKAAGIATAAALAAGFKKDVFTNLFSKEGLDSMAETWKTGFGGLFNAKGSGETDMGSTRGNSPRKERSASPPRSHNVSTAGAEMSFTHSSSVASPEDAPPTSSAAATATAGTPPPRTSPPARRSPGATISAGGVLLPPPPRSPSPEPHLVPTTHPAPPHERHSTRLSNTSLPSMPLAPPLQQQQQQQVPFQALQRPAYSLHHSMLDHHQVAHSTQSMSVPHTHYPSLVTTSVAQWNAAHANPVDDEEDTRVVVEEEVFENERFQPFRGWGSLWPGHFLPSDRIGRFGDRQGKPGGADSMQFERIAPLLPPGWKWAEENWEIDMDGYDMEAVDAEGWTYALDFTFLVHPPPMRTGKCSVKDFVRRRRLFRTRVRALPLHDTGEEQPTHDHEPSIISESGGSSEADGTYAEGVTTEEQALSNSNLDPRRVSVSGVHISDDHFATSSSPAHSASHSPKKDAVTIKAVVDHHGFAPKSGTTSNATPELSTQSLDSKEGEQASQASRHSPVRDLLQNPSAVHDSNSGGWLAEATAASAALTWQFDSDVAPSPVSVAAAANPLGLPPAHPAGAHYDATGGRMSAGGRQSLSSTNHLTTAAAPAAAAAAMSLPSTATATNATVVTGSSYPDSTPLSRPRPITAPGYAQSSSGKPGLLSPDSGVHQLRDPLGALGTESDDEDADAHESSRRPIFSTQQQPSLRARYSESDNDSIGSFHGASTSNSVSWPSPLASSRSRQRGLSQGGERMSLEQPPAGGYADDGALAAPTIVSPNLSNSTATAGQGRSFHTLLDTDQPAVSISRLPGSFSTLLPSVDMGTSAHTGPAGTPVSALAHEVASQIADASASPSLATSNPASPDPATAAGVSRLGEFSHSQAGGSSVEATNADLARLRQHTAGVPRRSGGMSGDDLLLSATRKLQLGVAAAAVASLPPTHPVQASLADNSVGAGLQGPAQDPVQVHPAQGSSNNTWAFAMPPETQSKTRTPLAASAMHPSMLRPAPVYSPLAPPEVPAPQGS